MITRIISGGQTGCDHSGLEAGFILGIETGGMMPKGFRTETGAMPQLKLLGLTEHVSVDYKPRTEDNVCMSTGTVIFGDITSAGSNLTLTYCKLHRRPVFIANGRTPIGLAEWLVENAITTLNVAGNRESRAPGIQARTRNFLLAALGSDPQAVVIHKLGKGSVKYDGQRDSRWFTALDSSGKRLADVHTLASALSFLV